MEAEDSCDRQEWTRLFVESAQAEQRRREEHTTDTRRSVQAYTKAAERKIKAALGEDLSVFTSSGSSCSNSSRRNNGSCGNTTLK